VPDARAVHAPFVFVHASFVFVQPGPETETERGTEALLASGREALIANESGLGTGNGPDQRIAIAIAIHAEM
jgi:hypothetical protein